MVLMEEKIIELLKSIEDRKALESIYSYVLGKKILQDKKKQGA